MKMLTARDLMSTEVATVRDDLTLEELASFLVENDISGAPVTDEGGRLVGVITLADLARVQSERGEVTPELFDPGFFARGWEGHFEVEELRKLHVESSGRLVREAMTPTVFSLPEETPVPEIARTLVNGHIHRVLVTREGQVVGVVSAMDLLELMAEERSPVPAGP